ncbi:type II toxin-antitoxin system MqsA family antitoxin [Candidatus Micrarchaeota archaeon]|nr:type II toxin-antitoxin system MqsA family antitoxin [Candidatus Micrarchaeota archaeon]MBU1939519.1 type II toxin-antitoxin system MqsA family antitoxin [Candidatus Micrarchaeota archaeon]
MKCVCGEKLEEIKTEMDFFDGKVIVRDVKAHYCPKCKEELFDSKEGDRIFNEVSKLNIAQPFESRKKIAKVGNSFAIPVSKEIADYMQIKKGGDIKIKVQNQKRLVIDLA